MLHVFSLFVSGRRTANHAFYIGFSTKPFLVSNRFKTRFSLAPFVLKVLGEME